MIEAGFDRASEQSWRYSDADWARKKWQRQATRYWPPEALRQGQAAAGDDCTPATKHSGQVPSIVRR